MGPSSPPVFRGRADAGLTLGLALDRVLGPRTGRHGVLVLGLARGGVAVAREVAAVIAAPLDVLVARKLGVPGMEEVALGAIAEGSDCIVDDPVGWYLGVPRRVVARIAARERVELARRVQAYRAGTRLHDVRGRIVVLVDDGLATGATMRAAARAIRARRPARLIAAVPVASTDGVDAVRPDVDDVVSVVTTSALGTVSAWYRQFPALTDHEVERLLGRTATSETVAPDGADARDEHTLAIDVGDGAIAADVGVPVDARGLVVLAHGGGSSRHSYRNRYVAGRLRHAGFATVRVDLLTTAEQQMDAADAATRFDVARIAGRLTAACQWSVGQALPGADRLGLIGASTGAAAALVVAASRSSVSAVVSRGGRVDLAGTSASLVRAPTLLVVGGADADTLRWNREALRRLGGPAQIAVVPRAGHTFEEPGALGTVAEHALRWFERHTATRRPRLTVATASYATLARVADLFAGMRSR